MSTHKQPQSRIWRFYSLAQAIYFVLLPFLNVYEWNSSGVTVYNSIPRKTVTREAFVWIFLGFKAHLCPQPSGVQRVELITCEIEEPTTVLWLTAKDTAILQLKKSILMRAYCDWSKPFVEMKIVVPSTRIELWNIDDTTKPNNIEFQINTTWHIST